MAAVVSQGWPEDASLPSPEIEMVARGLYVHAGTWAAVE